jgi:eukaryotic-like serine/threonine-protein kinase
MNTSPHVEMKPDRSRVVAGKYRLLSMLGKGGMGTVWRAEHLQLGAVVAVKLIDPEAAGSADGLRQCQKEARAAAALRGPHVVQVLDFGRDDASGSLFIVMELLEGESLADRVRRLGKLSLADTSRVLTHVARALSRAHEAAIVHRDLKPANVFLVRNDDDELAKVLDFGTARVQRIDLLGSGSAPAGGVVGTPHYMSPEHISGKTVDHRTDLWAMAVIAFECVTGRRPFDAKDVGHLVLQICTYPLPVPSRVAPVPAGFDVWFQRATRREPDQRFQSARELADDLRRIFVEAAPESAGRGDADAAGGTVKLAPPTERAPSRPRSRPGVSWLARGALLLALVAAIGAGSALIPRARTSNRAASRAPAATAVAPSPAAHQEPRHAVARPAATAQIGVRSVVAPVAPAPARDLARRKARTAHARPAPAASAAVSPAAVPDVESVLDHRR